MKIKRSAFQMHTLVPVDETRYPGLNSVRIERDGYGEALAVTTDGRHITVAKWRELDDDTDIARNGYSVQFKKRDAVMLAKNVASASAISSDPRLGFIAVDETSTDEKKVDATNGTTTASLSQVEGRFPNWESLVNDHHERANVTHLQIDASILAKIVKFISQHVDKDSDGSQSIRLEVPHDGALPVKITAKDDDGNSVYSLLATQSVKERGKNLPVKAPYLPYVARPVCLCDDCHAKRGEERKPVSEPISEPISEPAVIEIHSPESIDVKPEPLPAVPPPRKRKAKRAAASNHDNLAAALSYAHEIAANMTPHGNDYCGELIVSR